MNSSLKLFIFQPLSHLRHHKKRRQHQSPGLFKLKEIKENPLYKENPFAKILSLSSVFVCRNIVCSGGQRNPKNPFVCPKEGITPIQSYSGIGSRKILLDREGSGFLG